MTEPPGPRHSPGDVRLQVLLRPEWRNPRGVADVERALRELGFEVTGSGRASISARAAARTFSQTFAEHSRAEADESPGDRRALPVPAPLAGQVESITVAPQHTPMSRSAKPGDRRGRR
jgi:hypothetical protein